MRKLATGPHNGWQMIEWTRPSGRARFSQLARGQVCTSCHSQARKTDYVFTKRRSDYSSAAEQLVDRQRRQRLDLASSPARRARR